MSEVLKLRALRLDDLDAVAAMYTHHWGSEIPDPADLALVGRYNALIQLVRSPLTVVAEVDGVVAGVCLGCRIEGGRVPVVQQWVPLHEQTHALALERGKTADEYLGGELFCDEAELRLADSLVAAGNPYAEAQLTLFMVEPWLKGRGVGTALFEHMRSLLRAAGATRFFLMTDPSSDYAYYEHRGMELIRAFRKGAEDPDSWDRDSWAILVYGGTL